MPLVDKPAATTGCGHIGAVNRAMAVGAAVGHREAGSVVVADVALQAQRGLADRQQVGVWRSMGRVAAEAVFRYRRMLVSEGTAILCVAAQAKLVHVRRAQVMSRSSSVRVVAIGTTHFAFAQRVVVRHAHLRTLRLMTAQTSFVRHRARLNEDVGLRRDEVSILCIAGRCVEGGIAVPHNLHRVGMNLVAIDAANLVRSVRAACPVPGALVSSVATQADAVRVCCGALLKGDNFGGVSSAIDVEAAIAVALLASHALLRVIRMLKILSDIRVAGGAGCGANRLGARNL